MHDPIGAFCRIRDLYLSYLDTAFRIEDPSLSQERRDLLSKPGALCTSPLLEPLPSWRLDGRSFDDLILEPGDDAVLAPLSLRARQAFIALVGCGLIDRDRSGALYRPYHHQLKMLERGLRDGQAGIVTSGTGSGKTEAFLLPVLATIVEEATREDGGWASPGPDYLNRRWWRGADGKPLSAPNRKGDYELRADAPSIKGLDWDSYTGHEQRQGETRPAAIRALILYPMNALVEDQMTRLRTALDSQNARDILDQHLHGNRIFFGRYTGRTTGGPSHFRPHEKRLRSLKTGEGTALCSEKINGCADPRTLTKWKSSVAGSRARRITEVINELSQIDDLEAAIRQEAGIPPDRQVSLEDPREIKEKAFAFPSLDGAEMLTRWDMQEWPPDILVTNISMLNALLSRGTEARMLEITRDWLASDARNRFTLVIDELHLQRGSEGTEFIYLLRLLLVRLGLDQPDRHHQLRLLCSSASLPVHGEAREHSIDYLRDAFADFGLAWGASREDWLDAIVPGETERPSREDDHPRLSVNAAQVDQAIENLMASPWAPSDPDELLGEPDFHNHGASLSAFLDRLAVPPGNDPLERWEWLACAAGRSIESACTKDGVAAATPLSTIADRLWPRHGWTVAQLERNLRVLTAVVGGADRASPAGAALRALRQASPFPVPRFRLHTFFKSPEGIYVDVLPPAWRGEGTEEGQWHGQLSLERLGTRSAANPSNQSLRQFELLHCECCGECLVGGVRAGASILDDRYVEELLPNEADTEKLPDLPIASRFEELTYESYAIFWPSDDNSRNVDDPDNHESWRRCWLDPLSGVLRNSNGANPNLQAGYLFTRPERSQHLGIGNADPGSHTPCRCPRCMSDYSPKRRHLRSLFQLSPISSQRPGYGRTTQLLATEVYDVLARDGVSSKARLVSFSDSRQGAARTALDVEHLHHRDVLRELLLVTLLSESARLASAEREASENIKLLEDDIAAKRSRGLSDQSPLVKPLLEALTTIKTPYLYSSLGIIPLESILEMENPEPGDPVRPFLSELIRLRLHPYDERGLARLRCPNGEMIGWWQLFDKGPSESCVWCNPPGLGMDVREFKAVANKLLTHILTAIGDVVFKKNYFALEATGFAYPLPLPPSQRIADQQLNEEELLRAAAWMRIYTDDYRFAPSPFDTRRDPISVDEDALEKGRSSLARLILSLTRSLGGSSEDHARRGQSLMARYGHSSPADDYVRLERIGFRLPCDTEPYWRCPNCRRVHLHRGLGACTRCGHLFGPEPTGLRGDLVRSNVLGRRLRRSIDGDSTHGELFRLRCEELTGQTVDPASRQREFKGIKLAAERQHRLEPHGIEMLAVTTTMEVGIDIGPLEAVLQANMPPQRFNYQQRVGRAGRRGQAFSFVLTLCRSRSHDLHYFRHPESITGDSPPPPFLVKGLSRIAERLLRKDRLVHAFRWLEQRHRSSTGFWAGDLVRPVDVHGDFIPAAVMADPTLRTLWCQWLREALMATEADTLRTLAVLERQRSCDAVEAEPLHLETPDKLLEAMVEQIATVGANTVGLAAHLANYGLLPMYGLPTRVRELVLGADGQLNTKSLSRDLEVAIYEYAPGNVLIHDKQEHRCIGLTPRIGRVGPKLQTLQDEPWDRRFLLGRCPSCGAWQQLETPIEADHSCPSCLVTSPEDLWVCRWCVEPAGFRTDFDPQAKPTNQLQGSSGNTLCADASPPSTEAWQIAGTTFDSLPVRVQCTTANSTTVYRLNRGPDGVGFSFKWKDGVIKRPSAQRLDRLTQPRQGELQLKSQAIDHRLLNGADIQTILVSPLAARQNDVDLTHLFLAAPRVTDGLYLLPEAIHQDLAISFLGGATCIPGADPSVPIVSNGVAPLNGERYWQGVRAAAISATEMLIASATRRLDVDHHALQAVEPRPFRHNGEILPLIQIVDEHVNGAGFSAWLGDAKGAQPPIVSVIADVLVERASEWTNGTHGNDCQEACYGCLKSYDNQNVHGLLDWQLGLAYLRAFTDPGWACGLDGDFSWAPLAPWPTFAQRTAESTLSLWGGTDDNLYSHEILSGLELMAFRFPLVMGAAAPWVIVRHPLWRWGHSHGPLASFADHLRDEKGADRILCWDTFNLARRPGRTRQWIAMQGPRRRRTQQRTRR